MNLYWVYSANIAAAKMWNDNGKTFWNYNTSCYLNLRKKKNAERKQ